MTIRVLSFDFDRCLFNQHYKVSDLKDVIKSNEAFLDRIKKQNIAYERVYTFIGSNRQSKGIDDAGSRQNKTGSCFSAIQTVNQYLGATLDTFLLADIYGDLPDGTSFKNAVDKNFTGNHGFYLFDVTKATVMYAQIHKVANENPNEVIVLDFYDDMDTLLTDLKAFYTKHPELIPNNLTLRLHKYTGSNDELSQIAEIKGTGFIDSQYKQTVKDMTAQVDHPNSDISGFRVAGKVKPELLVNRTRRTSTVPDVQLSLAKDSAELPLVATVASAAPTVQFSAAYNSAIASAPYLSPMAPAPSGSALEKKPVQSSGLSASVSPHALFGVKQSATVATPTMATTPSSAPCG